VEENIMDRDIIAIILNGSEESQRKIIGCAQDDRSADVLSQRAILESPLQSGQQTL
jgi:hypothetical protein